MIGLAPLYKIRGVDYITMLIMVEAVGLEQPSHYPSFTMHGWLVGLGRILMGHWGKCMKTFRKSAHYMIFSSVIAFKHCILTHFEVDNVSQPSNIR